MSYPPVDVDYPERSELPTLLFEVRDEIVRQLRSHEAVYRGLQPEDEEAHRTARAHRLRVLRDNILHRLERQRELDRKRGRIGRPAPEHTCSYWRTREGFCSMCGLEV